VEQNLLPLGFETVRDHANYQARSFAGQLRVCIISLLFDQSPISQEASRIGQTPLLEISSPLS
jgi:hypothetical protein